MGKEVQLFSTQDIDTMAKRIGPLFGKAPNDMFALMLISQAEGLHPATAAQEYDIIQGKPAINSRAAQSRFQKEGGKIVFHEYTDQKCTATFSHPTGTEITVTWTIEDAKRIGLAGKNTWKQYPRQMLKARVVAEGVRACYPACLSGMYTTDELQDFIPDNSYNKPQTETPKAPSFRDVTPVKESEPEFPSEENEVSFNIRNYRNSHVGSKGEEVKLFILDYILEQSQAEQKKAFEIISDMVSGGRIEEIKGFSNLYSLHPAIINMTLESGQDVYDYIDSINSTNDGGEIYKWILTCYNVAKGE